MGRRTLPLLAALALVGALAVTGCSSGGSSGGSSGDADKAAEEQLAEGSGADPDQAAGAQTCADELTARGQRYGDGFPADWPFPKGSVVYAVEDRGEAGTIVAAVSPQPMKDVLAFMNGVVQDSGFEVQSGETEDHDAEAEWRSADFHGRWAIKDSTGCPGETSIEVLSTSN